MKLRLRLRTLMIAIALFSTPLYVVIVVCRQGGLAAFRLHHGRLAAAYMEDAARNNDDVKFYSQHALPGHLCTICQRFDRPLDSRIANAVRSERDYQRKARWHRFLSMNKVPLSHL